MKKLGTLLSLITALAVLSLGIFLELELHKFSSEGDQLIVMIGDYSLTYVLLVIFFFQVVGFSMLIWRNKGPQSDPDILDEF